VRRDHPAAGKDLTHVVEHDHSVAQQAPSLLRVTGDGAGGIAVPVVSRGARGLVGTHGSPLLWVYGCSGTLSWRCASSITWQSADRARWGARGQILITVLIASALTTNVHAAG
jgi:hypothetical protein